ncbi:MAG TPA: hypothetical protein VIV12_26375, partial [Streptosporangiaceae bacterium]
HTDRPGRWNLRVLANLIRQAAIAHRRQAAWPVLLHEPRLALLHPAGLALLHEPRLALLHPAGLPLLHPAGLVLVHPHGTTLHLLAFCRCVCPL